ncbi:uncharacterized protein [Prorops nasuta]
MRLEVARRPTMFSPKYRAGEERRRFLKISARKLRRIEDPESSLCRSVLINNAVKRLQKENRDEKTKSYSLPIINYLDDDVKENDVSNLIVTGDDDASRKRLSKDSRNDGVSPKRQRHDDLDLQDDVFSNFYILPPTPRLLSQIDEAQDTETERMYFEDRLSSGSISIASERTSSSTTSGSTVNGVASTSSFFVSDLDEISRSTTDMMEVADAVGCDADRICDFARFADSAKTLEERLVELQNFEDHFDLAKFERNNNQSCGRAFHDIQTFHSLVPGLET